jgi:Leucine Rich repeat
MGDVGPRIRGVSIPLPGLGTEGPAERSRESSGQGMEKRKRSEVTAAPIRKGIPSMTISDEGVRMAEHSPGRARWPRDRVRLSVRALMALVLLIAAGLGWVAYRARLQRDAVAVIVKAGGKVFYDGQGFDGTERPNPASGARAWLRKWIWAHLPDEYWRTVEMVDLRGTGIGDAGLAHLRALDRLDFLDLSGTKVTDAGLANLERLKHLKTLYLDDTAIGDAGLAHLEGLDQLETLSVGTSVTDTGLVHLKGFHRLIHLFLGKSKVTDAGLAAIAGLGQLRGLELHDTAVSDAGLIHLEGISGLYSLGLGGTRITDAGLIHLEGLTGLGNLTLSDTRVTDAGMVHLKDLVGLYTLYLDGTNVGDAGLVHLGGMSRLDLLSLERTRVTDAGLTHLEGLGGLGSLLLDGTRVSPERKAVLQRVIPGVSFEPLVLPDEEDQRSSSEPDQPDAPPGSLFNEPPAP